MGAEALAIPRECFAAVDLNKAFEADRRFDLAISMEVAEHLAPEISANFVRSLTRLSDIVLFSAAVPGRGGTNHINEQWPSYWSNLFRNENFEVVDLNVTTRSDLIESLRHDRKPPLCVIHPELYSFKDRFFLINIMDAEISAREAFKLFSIRVRKAIQRRVPGRKA